MRRIPVMVVLILSLARAAQSQNQIVFTRGGDLWLMEADGQGLRPLTQTDVREEAPACSPDGELIAYQIYDAARRTYDVWVMNADGTNPRTLVLNGRSPAWSPSCGLVAFVSERRGSQDLWMVGRETGKIQRLTSDPSPEIAPAWSPLGDRLAFIRLRYLKNAAGERRGCISQLMVREFNGRIHELVRLGNLELTKVAWSGRDQLVLAGTPYGQADARSRLWMVSARGKGLRQLTSQLWLSESQPAWFPEGRGLVFVRQEGGLQCLWRLSEDGRDRRPLTVGQENDDAPAFLAGGPDRAWRVFLRGQRAFLTPAPHLRGQEVMLPARPVCEALGILFLWDAATQVLELSHGPHKVRINLRHRAAKRDGRAVALENWPQLISGVTVLPMRRLAEWLGLPGRGEPEERILRLGEED